MVFFIQAPRQECVIKSCISYFTTKTYVVGNQKNNLNETVSYKKIFTILCAKGLFNPTYAYTHQKHWPGGYKTFFMLYSNEHQISIFKIFLVLKLSDAVFILLILAF